MWDERDKFPAHYRIGWEEAAAKNDGITREVMSFDEMSKLLVDRVLKSKSHLVLQELKILLDKQGF
jgi:hypothetical protein